MDIVDAIYSYLPAKRKQTPSGWTKFNAVCCQHNGNTPDTRARAGIIRNAEGCSYHCFNCGYKASYIAGRHLTRKMRNLLSWFGAPDDVITKLSLEALRIEQDSKILEAITIPSFENKSLPKDSVKLDSTVEITEYTARALEYIYNERCLSVDDYDFYWSPEYSDRVIVPFIYQGRIVGYTARKLVDGKPKYISDQTPGYVFNIDNQERSDREIVIVTEGPFDAISIDGVAILGADIMDKQALIISRLGKKVVVLPDRDADGARTVAQALDLGWSVSFPNWSQDIKDANAAVVKYGKLWTLRSIIDGIEDNALKIKLRMKKWEY
jgi:hypothetical protein